MSFFFNEVVASNSNSNLVGFNFLIFKELDSSNLIGSNSVSFTSLSSLVGSSYVAFTLLGSNLLGFSLAASNFNNKLLVSPSAFFYSTSPLSPTSRFFSLGPPGIQANASCFDHLVYPEPLLSYFKHSNFSCQLYFADNLLHFRRSLESNNLQPVFPQTFINQSYNSHIDNSSLSHNQQGGIFFQFSLPKFRLSSFPFALYISRPSSLVPSPSDSHPLEPLDFNRSFYSQNLPSYVGFLGRYFTSIGDFASDSAHPVDDSIDSSIGSSSSSVGTFASHNVQSIRNINSISSGSGVLSICEIPSFHHFLNLRSRTASFFAFLDSFFLLDSPFLDSLPSLDLSSSDFLFSSNHLNSLLSNLNPLHPASSRLGDAHFLFNNPLAKLLVSSTYALCDEPFLSNDPLFSINREHFCPHEELFYSNSQLFPLHEEHFLLDEQHFPLTEEHFLSNNRIFTSDSSFPVEPLASLSSQPRFAPLSHFFVGYAFLTSSNFSNFSSFSNFARLVTFSSFAHCSINYPLSNHMDSYYHLDNYYKCLSVNFSFYRLHSNSPSWFPSHHLSTSFIFILYICVLRVQNSCSFFHFIAHNRVSKLPNPLTFFNFFSNLTLTLSLFKLPNSIFFNAFSCKNLINLIFWPSILSGFDVPNLSFLLFGASNSNVFSGLNKCHLLNLASNLKFSSSQKQCHLLIWPSFLSLFESLNLSNFQFWLSNSSVFEGLNKYDLLNLASHLKFSSGQKQCHLLNLPFNLSAFSCKHKSYLFNLASHLSVSSHKNKYHLLHCSSFLSAFVDNNSSTFLNSPSLKALLLKHSSSFSSSTSKQISNNLSKKPNNLRSHYRIKMSFEAKVNSQFAISLARNYLLEQFPSAILLAACHQNTNHTHIHVLLFARDVDGKKLHFSNFNYKKLDIGWAKLYAKVFGEHKLEQHIDKKAQSRNWKKDRFNGVERDKPHRISINNRLDHTKNYGDNYKNLCDLVDHQPPVKLLFTDPFVNFVGNNIANPDKNIVKNIDFGLNHTSNFVKNLAFDSKFLATDSNLLPLQPNLFAFSVDRNLANNLSSSLFSQSNSLTFGVRNLSFEPINLAFDVKNASNFDKSDPLHFSFSCYKDLFSSSKDPIFCHNNLSFSYKQQVFLAKQPDFFGTFFDHNHTFSHNFLDHKLSFWNNNPVDFASYSNSNAILDNKEHLHLLPSINFNLDHNQHFLDHKLPFWHNNPLDFSTCSQSNSVFDNKEHHHLQPSINLSDNFADKHFPFNCSVFQKHFAFNTSFSHKDFVSHSAFFDKDPSCNDVFLDKVVDKYIVSNELIVDKYIARNSPDHDKVALIDKDLAHHQPSLNLSQHHDPNLNQTHNPFSYHHYLDLIDSFERDYFHIVSERELLERELADRHFNEIENDFGQNDFVDARFLDADSRSVGNDFDETNLVGKAPAENDFNLTGIETVHDYDEPSR